MISNLFFDLDNTLIASLADWEITGKEEGDFLLLDLPSGEAYKLFIRPGALNVINYARALVGIDKVFILTAATKNYALKINELAGFRFNPKNIFSREDMRDIPCGYGYQTPSFKGWARENVLIDDLSYESHTQKAKFIGTDKEHFLQIPSYKGIEYSWSDFENKVYKFLDKKMKE